MSKSHRGTGIRNEANHGRGKCPICGKDQVKTLYDQDVDGKKVKICKICKAHLKNKARAEAKVAKAAAPAAESTEA